MPELLQKPKQILLSKAGRDDDAKQFLTLVYPLPTGKGRLMATLNCDVKARHSFTGKEKHLTLDIVNTDMIVETGKQVDSLLHGCEAI